MVPEQLKQNREKQEQDNKFYQSCNKSGRGQGEYENLLLEKSNKTKSYF